VVKVVDCALAVVLKSTPVPVPGQPAQVTLFMPTPLCPTVKIGPCWVVVLMIFAVLLEPSMVTFETVTGLSAETR